VPHSHKVGHTNCTTEIILEYHWSYVKNKLSTFHSRQDNVKRLLLPTLLIATEDLENSILCQGKS